MQQSGKLAARQFRLKQPGITEMDRLQQLVETLRVLARTNEPNRVVLIEKAINEYLNDKAGIVRLSLERLCNDIDREEADALCQGVEVITKS